MKTIRSSLLRFLLCLLLAATASSCVTKRAVTSDAQFARELSRSLKVPLSSHDNLLLYAFINDWIGVPHRYGGNSKRGIDCSNFVRQIEWKTYKRNLSRNSKEMYRNDIRKISKNKLREGDLVFFATGKRKHEINHVGIYLKQGRFAHTSTSRGVMISSLDEEYFRKTYKAAGRVK